MGWLIISLSVLCMTSCGGGSPTAPRNVSLDEDFVLAPSQVAFTRSGILTSLSRATFRSSAAKAGAAARTSSLMASGTPRVSMKLSRRCTR